MKLKNIIFSKIKYILALLFIYSSSVEAGIYCKYLSSCAEACKYYNQGYYRLDRDRDGIPCENLCSSPCGVSKAHKKAKKYTSHKGYKYKTHSSISHKTTKKNIKHHKERYYQKAFCKKVLGIMEYPLSDGTRIDCYTSTYSFEVDFGHKAYEAIGQALHYSTKIKNKAGIVLIKETKRDNRYINRIKAVAKKYNIKVFTITPDLKVRILK